VIRHLFLGYRGLSRPASIFSMMMMMMWNGSINDHSTQTQYVRQTWVFEILNSRDSLGSIQPGAFISWTQYASKGKGKGRYSSSWEPHLRAMGRHLPYRITQCYLPPDTSERVMPNPSHAGWVNLADLIAPRPGVKPATFRSQVQRRTAVPPRQPQCRTPARYYCYWPTDSVKAKQNCR